MSVKLQDDIIVLVGANPQAAGTIGDQSIRRLAMQIHDFAFDRAARGISPQAIDANDDPVRLAVQRTLVRHSDDDHHAIGGTDDPQGDCRNLPLGIPKDQIQKDKGQRWECRLDWAP